MSQHTAGPWCLYSAHPAEQYVDQTTSDAEMRKPLFRIHHDDNVPQEQAEANARVIAAAPEMLEALNRAEALIKLARQYFPKSVRNSHRFNLELTSATVSKALYKAAQS